MKPGFATCESLSAESRHQVKPLDPHDSSRPCTAWSLTLSTRLLLLSGGHGALHSSPLGSLPSLGAGMALEGWMLALAGAAQTLWHF